MYGKFLPPAVVAALGAWEIGYSRRFVISASSDGITANSAGSDSIPITGGLHFFTERVAISYPTLVNISGTETDDYVTRLTLQLALNTNLSLFTAPVPLQLIAVPGRQPTAGVAAVGGGAAAPGQPPHIPGWAWNSFIPDGTDFQHNFANLSTYEATVDVFWQGWNIPNGKCRSEEEFWAIVAKYAPAPVGT
jgi:hypothetical protein